MTHKRLVIRYKFKVLIGSPGQFKLHLWVEFFQMCGNLC